MNFAWVGFEREINSDIIINILKEKFNLSHCYGYETSQLESWQNKLNLSNASKNPSVVFYEVTRNESEFPIVWEFVSFPDLHDWIRVDLVMAYYLSQSLNCKTITDGTGFGLDNSEYWDIVFDNEKVFLVDDLNTKFYGDGHNRLKVVKEMDLQKLIKKHC
ncbi:hypothetical protein [Candidatus Clostridium stratigraminis]|uniref:Uncharacterized protein n=1 Tax=Candidatus Clostridium stratigraminis TaxID=3381661 RepID=A0ABW8T6S3_9CLOT